VLDGSCRTPLAGFARVEGDHLSFRGMALRPDGSEAREIAGAGPVLDAYAIGEQAGLALRADLPPGFMSVD
jgi:hydroxymethylbilane synthase